MLNLSEALKVALAAAEKGAAELMAGYGRHFEVRRKGPIDLVTEFDLRSEAVVKDILGRAFPEHTLVGEEGGAAGASRSPYRWHIDPLDGTTNFAHGHPFFAVSIGLFGPDAQGTERPLVGVVLAPVLGELFWGCRGGGAFRRQALPGRGFSERRLKVTEVRDMKEALLNTGFPYDVFERGGEILGPFGRLLTSARAVRRAGAASLDIAYVAAGLADGFWESGLKSWDVAAGLLLLDEAGGRVTDYAGGPYVLGQSRDIAGSNGLMHDQMLALIKG